MDCSYLSLSNFKKPMKWILSLAIVLALPAWGQEHCKNNHRTRFETQSILDVNIGYRNGKGPVPLTPQCLFPQLGQSTGTTTIYARAVVEPTIAVNPKNRNYIVVSWQQSRMTNGGSLEAPIAYSRNGGKTWSRTVIPLQDCLGGINQRISDVWLSYAPDGERLYFTVLVVNASEDINTQNQQGIIVAVSEDNGRHWSIPHFVTSSSLIITNASDEPFHDKNAITADRNHAKLAYCVWDTIDNNAKTFITRTEDGGTTWSQNQLLYDPFPDLTLHGQSNGNAGDNGTIGNVIVVLPEKCGCQCSGDLLNFMFRTYAKPGTSTEEYNNDKWPYQFRLSDIAFVRSRDLGKTWETNATIVTSYIPNQVFTGGYTYGENGQITEGVGTQLRTGDIIPSYNVNPQNGNLYVAFQTSQFRADQLTQIGLTVSKDGGFTWSQPVKVSRTPENAQNPQAFTPFVAVTKNGYVGILYHDFRNDKKSDPSKTKTDVWLAIYREVPHEGSTGIGLEFVREERLSQHSYIIQNGPNTTIGVMTNGDYPFLVAEGNWFYAIYIKSQRGPFTPAVPILTNAETGGVLLLDDNYRTAPFFSAVKEKN